jgi:hypothetical protein
LLAIGQFNFKQVDLWPFNAKFEDFLKQYFTVNDVKGLLKVAKNGWCMVFVIKVCSVLFLKWINRWSVDWDFLNPDLSALQTEFVTRNFLVSLVAITFSRIFPKLLIWEIGLIRSVKFHCNIRLMAITRFKNRNYIAIFYWAGT